MDTMTGGFCFVPWAVADDPRLMSYEKIVYLALCRFSGRHGKCFPSRNTVASLARISLTQTKKSLGKLKATGYITRERRQGERGNDSNVYRLKAIEARAQSAPGGARHALGGAQSALGWGAPRPLTITI